MSNIDKQALRQLAEKAGGEEWESRKEPGIGSEYTVIVKGSLKKNQGWSTYRPVAEQVFNKKTMDFISAANPAAVLALLDELEAAKQDSARWFKAFEKAVSIGARYEERIAELEARAVNLPKRSVAEVMHMSGFSRDYAEGWCSANDNAIHEIRAAGIGVKGD